MGDAREDAGASEAALLRLAHLYAQACDRNAPDAFAELFAPDGAIQTPSYTADTPERIRRIPGFLARTFIATRHEVMNQIVHVRGDEADGETYGSASHISRLADGRSENWIWSIRYQDRFQRLAGRWLFRRRTLVVDWTEKRIVQPGLDLPGAS